jgi:integrase/recombinase XerD
LRITVNGERAEISTNRKVNPGLWNKTSQRVAGRTEPTRIINSSLNNLVSKVEKYFSSLDVKDELISVHQIIEVTCIMEK